MKARYRIWHLPVLSFYSKRFYRDVSSRWKGTNLGYLCLLLAVCLIPTSRNAWQKTSAIIDEKADVYLMQIPPMHFTDGKLTVDAPQPYSIIDGNDTILVIDTTGTINTLENAGSYALLTATQLIVAEKGQTPEIYDLQEFDGLEMNEKIAATMIEKAKAILAPVFHGLIYVTSLVILLIVTLILGAVARIFGEVQNKEISYGAGLRISVVALTPPAILWALLASARLHIPAVLYLLVALFYLYTIAGAAKARDPNDLYLDEDPVGH
jgi:hypothetical protein